MEHGPLFIYSENTSYGVPISNSPKGDSDSVCPVGALGRWGAGQIGGRDAHECADVGNQPWIRFISAYTLQTTKYLQKKAPTKPNEKRKLCKMVLESRDTLSSKSEQLPIASYIYFHIKLTFYQHAQIFKRLCRNKLVSLLVFFFLKFSVVACHSGKIRRHSHRVFCSKMKKSKNKWNYVGSLGMNKINIIQT